MYTNFQLKRTTLIFLAEICPKRKLEFENQETNVGIEISILEIPCVPIFRQNRQLWAFGAKFGQKSISVSKFQKSKSGFESASLWYYVHQFSNKTDNFEFLGPNLPKNKFWGRNIKNLSLDLESASMRYCVHHFLDKTDNFEFFGPNLPKNGFWGSEFLKSKSGFEISTTKIPCVPISSQNGQLLLFWPKFGEIAQLRAIFWFKYCWGCCRELGGDWNELGGGGWSWVELAGCTV